ncbi:uncharacterized protein BDR25DRAFT_357214 [Lindgomyces ingoldianus]|uniref:Uncharacterized protein n=1 Tax=Lindgomyces ingoldianus TaxID=673940 RepID=A0ACB6QQP8_9PLEO|nr:uncharacterized protein BDR25DRAFT_357214 [Lindgomyces ingoldianus]KAF2468850.1 hypothetical protein BDR25DRAFT_357214 [Lindgomyces ingoldianus]
MPTFHFSDNFISPTTARRPQWGHGHLRIRMHHSIWKKTGNGHPSFSLNEDAQEPVASETLGSCGWQLKRIGASVLHWCHIEPGSPSSSNRQAGSGKVVRARCALLVSIKAPYDASSAAMLSSGLKVKKRNKTTPKTIPKTIPQMTIHEFPGSRARGSAFSLTLCLIQYRIVNSISHTHSLILYGIGRSLSFYPMLYASSSNSPGQATHSSAAPPPRLTHLIHRPKLRDSKSPIDPQLTRKPQIPARVVRRHRPTIESLLRSNTLNSPVYNAILATSLSKLLKTHARTVQISLIPICFPRSERSPIGDLSPPRTYTPLFGLMDLIFEILYFHFRGEQASHASGSLDTILLKPIRTCIYSHIFLRFRIFSRRRSAHNQVALVDLSKTAMKVVHMESIKEKLGRQAYGNDTIPALTSFISARKHHDLIQQKECLTSIAVAQLVFKHCTRQKLSATGVITPHPSSQPILTHKSFRALHHSQTPTKTYKPFQLHGSFSHNKTGAHRTITNWFSGRTLPSLGCKGDCLGFDSSRVVVLQPREFSVLPGISLALFGSMSRVQDLERVLNGVVQLTGAVSNRHSGIEFQTDASPVMAVVLALMHVGSGEASMLCLCLRTPKDGSALAVWYLTMMLTVKGSRRETWLNCDVRIEVIQYKSDDNRKLDDSAATCIWLAFVMWREDSIRTPQSVFPAIIRSKEYPGNEMKEYFQCHSLMIVQDKQSTDKKITITEGNILKFGGYRSLGYPNVANDDDRGERVANSGNDKAGETISVLPIADAVVARDLREYRQSRTPEKRMASVRSEEMPRYINVSKMKRLKERCWISCHSMKPCNDSMFETGVTSLSCHFMHCTSGSNSAIVAEAILPQRQAHVEREGEVNGSVCYRNRKRGLPVCLTFKGCRIILGGRGGCRVTHSKCPAKNRPRVRALVHPRYKYSRWITGESGERVFGVLRGKSNLCVSQPGVQV